MWHQRLPMPQVRPNTAKKKKARGSLKGLELLQEEVQKGVGAVTAGEGAAAAPLACLLRSEPGQCCLDTCPGRRSQPQRAGGRVSLSQWHTWQVCVLLQWVQKHTHTHPRNMGYVCMHMCREHAKCNRTDSCTHEHCTDRHTPLQTCRPSMYTHTPGVT